MRAILDIRTGTGFVLVSTVIAATAFLVGVAFATRWVGLFTLPIDAYQASVLAAVTFVGAICGVLWAIVSWIFVRGHAVRTLRYLIGCGVPSAIVASIMGLAIGPYQLLVIHPLYAVAIWAGTHGVIAMVSAYYSRRLMTMNTCANCGYDLTGNVTGRCSECGASIDEQNK